MDKATRSSYKRLMADNLSLLRGKAGLTQEQLAVILDVSRQTIISAENNKREITWTMFIALLFVFKSNPNTLKLLRAFDILTEELETTVSV